MLRIIMKWDVINEFESQTHRDYSHLPGFSNAFFRKSLLCFTNAAFVQINQWQENKLWERRWFFNNYSSDIYEQLQVHDLMDPKNF